MMLSFFYKKNSATPITETIAPTTSRGLIFSLKNIIEGKIIKTGAREDKVAAIPVSLYFTAIKLNETPRNGPTKAPREMLFTAEKFLSPAKVFFHFLAKLIMIAKQMIPVIILI